MSKSSKPPKIHEKTKWNTHSKIGQNEFIQSWKDTVIEFIQNVRQIWKDGKQ